MSEVNDFDSISEENNQHYNRKPRVIVDYELDLDEREAKFMDYNFESCKECSQVITNESGCLSCNAKRFQRDLDKWTSGNKIIDKLIQDSQLSAENLELELLLEWIPYNRFTDIKYIAEGGFAKVYSATWTDGQIVGWSQISNNWKREGSIKVALKVLNNSSKNLSEDFINEVKTFNKIINGFVGIISCFGITQDPNTQNYALVLQLQDSGLRFYLDQNYNSLTRKRKLHIICSICRGLYHFHDKGLIHKDLHIGNILYSIIDNDSYVSISDFGFCKPADEISANPRIYGVMPYMAPEILRGEEYTQASDIYSLDICHGKRPEIRKDTPDFLKDFIQKCWDADPENRPSYKEVTKTLYRAKDENDEIFEELSDNFIEESTDSFSKIQLETHSQAIYTSRPLKFSNLPKPVNCSNQEEFISSRPITQVYTDTVHSECTDCAIID